jgi:hypothetical protein
MAEGPSSQIRRISETESSSTAALSIVLDLARFEFARTQEVAGTKLVWPHNYRGQNLLAKSYRFPTHKELGFTYSFFGLLFRSNLQIPGVHPASQPVAQSDVEVHFGIAPCSAEEDTAHSEELTYVSSDTNAIGEPALRIWNVKQGTFVRLAYEDGTQFWLDRKRENLWVTWAVTSSLENAASYLLGPVLGLLLRLRGVTCLHASAVAFEKRSVALVGSAGAGKSTTAAAFARQGYGVISDDITALVEHEGAFQVMPAYPYLCLWPESVKMLYDSPEALPRLSPGWDKRRLALGDHGTRFENRCLPLGAIYVLSERRPDPAPYVEAIRSRSALLALVADTYANKILDRDLRAREFIFLSRLVTTVPIRRVFPHEDETRLQELCKVIREDFASLDFPTSMRP